MKLKTFTVPLSLVLLFGSACGKKVNVPQSFDQAKCTPDSPSSSWCNYKDIPALIAPFNTVAEAKAAVEQRLHTVSGIIGDRAPGAVYTESQVPEGMCVTLVPQDMNNHIIFREKGSLPDSVGLLRIEHPDYFFATKMLPEKDVVASPNYYPTTKDLVKKKGKQLSDPGNPFSVVMVACKDKFKKILPEWKKMESIVQSAISGQLKIWQQRVEADRQKNAVVLISGQPEHRLGGGTQIDPPPEVQRAISLCINSTIPDALKLCEIFGERNMVAIKAVEQQLEKSPGSMEPDVRVIYDALQTALKKGEAPRPPAQR